MEQAREAALLQLSQRHTRADRPIEQQPGVAIFEIMKRGSVITSYSIHYTKLYDDRDVVIEVVATELETDVITTGDIMLQKLIVVRDDAGLLETSKLMASKGVRRLPVVSKSGELIGIVTLDDLLEITANIFINLTKSLTKEQNVITSYSIHYTKLYDH